MLCIIPIPRSADLIELKLRSRIADFDVQGAVSCVQMEHADREAEDEIIHVMIDLNKTGPMMLERPDPDQERYRLTAARQPWKLYDEHW